MDIPFVDLSRGHREVERDLRSAFERLLAGGDFVFGNELDLFEQEFARYVGVEHCVGVGSGTAALSLALRAMEIGGGDEVIVPAHTFIASALAVVHAGAVPVFCDVDEKRGLIDLDSAAAAVGERTAAVLPVHLYGQACDMEALRDFGDDYQLAVLEDAAQAHGARWQDRVVGSFGTASAFSFYPSKNLGALGDGGAICTNDTAVAQRARALRNLGQRKKGEHAAVGYNERLDTLQAAFLRVKLSNLDRWNASRRAAAARYAGNLPEGVRTPADAPNATDVFHLYAVRVDDRQHLATTLRHAGIQTGVHYSPAVHKQPPFVNDNQASFPVAERWARDELSLPMFPGLEAGEVDHVCATLEERCGGRTRSAEG